MKPKALLFAITSLMLAVAAQAQDIQDTFFNMPFGLEYTAEDIAFCVGENGEFKYTMDRGKFDEVIFFDTEFDGIKWSLADFYTNKESKFYRFRVSNNYTDREQAVALYDAVKAQLDEKYKLRYTKGGGDNILNRYDGDNDIKLMLTFNLQTSLGGDSFYYVTLDYIQWTLYQSL